MTRIAAFLGSLLLVVFTGCSATNLGAGNLEGEEGLGEVDAGQKDDNPRETRDTCGNGIDDDEDGEIDEGCPCTLGATQACWTGDPEQRRVGACKDGVQTCYSDDGEFHKWSGCEDEVLPSPDTTDDGIDQDCDGDGSEPSCRPTAESCTNGKDDDCDGKMDCADSDCAAAQACAPACVPTAEACGNGKDDDCDGKVDCSDSNCAGNAACAPACVPTAESCTNGKDDDCDGKVDCADSNCSTHSACAPACEKEWNREWDCNDGKDDDCNGKTDCDDPECMDENECSCIETCTPGAWRYCDEEQFCAWGTQTCGPDKRWGSCKETQSRPNGCGGENFYDEDCCVDAGACCQAMHLLTPLDYSVGTCQPVSVTCSPR